MKKILPSLFFGLILDCYAQQYPIVFPKSEKQCIKVKQPCSYNAELTCNKEYCGVSYYQYNIDQFSKKNSLIGTQFKNIFDMEDYFKNNLPLEFKNYSIRLIESEGFSESDYESHRVTVLIKKLTIVKIILN